MRRIALIGPGGAGKSTLARVLGERLGLPVFHLDGLYWKPGWVAPPRAEWLRLHAHVVGGEGWIIDGNYGGSMDVRLAAADTVVYLDLPRGVCVWRALRRAVLGRGRSRPDMAPGCPERVDLKFLWWIWTYSARRRPALMQKLSALPPDTRVLRLRSDREVRAFLRQVPVPPDGVAAGDRSPAS